MDDAKLITLVENCDVLYNKFNKEYRIPEKKRAAWSRISIEMGIAEEYCIKRWSSLRDRYAKEKKNERMASGSGASFKHRWQYMNQLEFLQPHVIARPVRSTTNILEQSSHASNKGSDAFQQPSPYCSTESINVDTYFSDVQYIDTQFLETETEASTSPATTAKPLKQKSKKRCGTFDDTDQIFADAVETCKKFCQSKEEREMQKENNRIHAFSKMVCATLQTLSENKQTRGIQQITDVLTKLKLEPE